MRNILKNSKGITLIALVITIIVLLILAGITIASLTGENGLLSRAVDAKKEAEKTAGREQIETNVIASYGKDGKIDLNLLNKNLSTIEGLTTDEKGTKHISTDPLTKLSAIVYLNKQSYIIDGSGTVREAVIADRIGINVGDYINYTPDIPATTVYPKDRLEKYSGSTSNSSDIVQDTLNWQVLRIYDDGALDVIGSCTYQPIYLAGIKGYTNGAYLMDDICKTLYSRNGIEARSVDIRDFEYWLEKSAEGVSSRSAYKGYGEEKTYEPTNNKYPLFYKTQKNESDRGSLTEDEITSSDENLTIKQTFYYLAINEANFSEGALSLAGRDERWGNIMSCWVASRFAEHGNGRASFSFWKASKQLTRDGNSMYYSDGQKDGTFSFLRPVVHLSSNVKIEAKSGTQGSDAHQIKSY